MFSPSTSRVVQHALGPSPSPEDMLTKAEQLRTEAALLEADVAAVTTKQRMAEVTDVFASTQRGDGYVGAAELERYMNAVLLQEERQEEFAGEDMSALAAACLARFDGEASEADGLLSLEEFPTISQLMAIMGAESANLTEEKLRVEKERLEQVLEQNSELYESLAEQSKGSNGILGTGITFNYVSAFAWNAGPALFGAWFVSRIIAQGILEGEESASRIVESLAKITDSGGSPF